MPGTNPCLHTIAFWLLCFVTASSAAAGLAAPSGEIALTSPISRQVIQRDAKNLGTLHIDGTVSGAPDRIEAKADLDPAATKGQSVPWTIVATREQIKDGRCRANLQLAAGGWYTFSIRCRQGEAYSAETTVGQVGVGDVFITAGQSNSANLGDVKQTASDDRVVYFDGTSFVPAVDPMPGAMGSEGSIWPILGDMLVRTTQMPVCFRSVSIHYAPVRDWLPKSEQREHPYYQTLIDRTKQFGPNGVRAILWHQGEDDAKRGTSTDDYARDLTTVIESMRKDIGYHADWFVADAASYSRQTGYSPRVIQGQKLIAERGVAFRGPDTDDLAEKYRRSDGGHMNHLGLTTHAERWYAAISRQYDLANPLSSSPLVATGVNGSGDWFTVRGGLENSRIRFSRDKVGRVAFLGGSITYNPGWRDMVCEELQRRFPQTRFDFVAAGIPSMGSTPGAFRLERDVLAGGKVDLLFEEAAVNDSANGFTPTEMTRGMEGIVRHALSANPTMDIVLMHFVDPEKIKDYDAGREPAVIARHEAVAERYGVPSINLALEVTQRIASKEFTWEKDFKDLHPSPFGQRLYFETIKRMFDKAWPAPLVEDAKQVARKLPDPIDRFSYARGRLVPPDQAHIVKGWVLDPRWKAPEGQATRDGFVDVPMLVATEPGATAKLKFTGTGVGLFVAAGPDAGMVQYSIDGSPMKSCDLFTQWSAGLHLPWAVLLDAELKDADHELTLRVSDQANPKSRGHAVRIVHFLVNG